MKAFAIILILVFVSLNFGFSQIKKMIHIPVLKEDMRIDSLLEIASSSIATYKSQSDWFILYMIKTNPNRYFFSLGGEDEASINHSVNRMIDDKCHCGFFKYKKFKVFVWANESIYPSLNDFFLKKGQFKSFIKTQAPTKNFIDMSLWSCSYDYRDGHFSVDNPPSVR